MQLSRRRTFFLFFIFDVYYKGWEKDRERMGKNRGIERNFEANGLDGESLNVSGQSSVALSYRKKLSYARCCTNPRKRVLSLRTRSLFRFHIGVRLGRKPQ